VEKYYSDRRPFYAGRYYGGKYQLLKSYPASSKGCPIMHKIKNKRNVIKTKHAGFYGYTKYTDALEELKHERIRFKLCNFKIMFCLFEKVFELGNPISLILEDGSIALRACKRTLLAEMNA
jgi:hypothetical protein